LHIASFTPLRTEFLRSVLAFAKNTPRDAFSNQVDAGKESPVNTGGGSDEWCRLLRNGGTIINNKESPELPAHWIAHEELAGSIYLQENEKGRVQ
jgi:hypothetical protein